MKPLKSEKEFNKIFSTGKRYKEKHIRAIISESSEKEIKLAIVTGKKIGTAVTRNKIRRRTREAIRAKLRESNKISGLIIAIFPYITAKNAPFNELKLDIENIFNRAGLN